MNECATAPDEVVTDNEYVKSRVFEATVTHVAQSGIVTVTVNLGWGVFTERRIVIEGIGVIDRRVGEDTIKRIVHCLVILLGGKRIIIQTTDTRSDTARMIEYIQSVQAARASQQRVPTFENTSMCRVYHYEQSNGVPKECLAVPAGMTKVRADVGLLYGWIAARGFNPTDARAFAARGSK